jgi:signal peptidase II
VIAAGILAGDQITKAVVTHFITARTVISVIPHFFNLIYAENAGAAFSLFSASPAPWKTALLIAVRSVLLAVMIVLIWRSRRMRWAMGIGFSLIMGGALSNLIDCVRHGRVIDFLDVYYRSYHWPTFNLADSAIVVGAGLVVVQMLMSE